ncbi:hypothetical protein SMSP2_02498 [Limihaloglobus sulfuriphilus]|uniref:Methylcobalamin:coenzyme M methyltransferase n=1 Tax=Limihaloglobus sulfuriphilus TaxID=1851148 RepID=A0A1Q2MIJ1_9BACT|nr:hypothetical protein [Limihaloglobus sulfuriphilus]AQQ72117.1 hypothetical protein SMSP2_02498 [Limihaloglobus sulfuriphilus]
MELNAKKQLHFTFWSGNGPSLIFIPSADLIQYDVDDYESRFSDPAKMYESEIKRASAIIDWPTDGIPTIRPNLGTIFIPAIAGQDYMIRDGQMPWPGSHFTVDQIRSLKNIDIENAQMMRLALEFYSIHRSIKSKEIECYHPDTQGVYDILHLLRGDELFYEMITEVDQTKELLGIITDLYVEVTKVLKAKIGEPANEMIHGHGTQQGLFFPQAGTRLSEDTDTLLSPAMIDEFAIPYMEQASKPFGGAFVHYCGKHEYLYEKILDCDFVRAIDLGNPEMYNTEWLLQKCAETDTVFYGKLAAQENEIWQDYIIRISKIIKKTGARCVLRPTVFPEIQDQCHEMLEMWHELTV